MFKSLDKFVFYNFNYYQHYPFHKWKNCNDRRETSNKSSFYGVSTL